MYFIFTFHFSVFSFFYFIFHQSYISCFSFLSFFSGRDFILPLFIHESDAMEEISSMPGCFRHSVASMLAEVEEAMR